MLKHIIQEAAMVVNSLEDGFLSSVGDEAVVDVRGMRNTSISLNLISNVAILDLSTKTTHFNTVVGAKNSASPPSIIVGHTAGSKAGTISETGNTTTLEYDPTVSQVSDMEALLATSIYMNIITHGTAGNTLATPADDVASTPLAAADATFSVLIEKTTDGTNWTTVATVAQSAFPSLSKINVSVEETLSQADARPDPVLQVRASLTAMDGVVRLSLSAAGLQEEDYR